MSWDERFLGIPYLHRGRSFDGADCVGLLDLYLRETGRVGLPDYDYGSEWEKETPDMLVDRLSEFGVGSGHEGDIVGFRYPSTGWLFHVGVVIDPYQRFLHAKRGSNSCVSSLTGWGARFEHMYFTLEGVAVG